MIFKFHSALLAILVLASPLIRASPLEPNHRFKVFSNSTESFTHNTTFTAQAPAATFQPSNLTSGELYNLCWNGVNPDKCLQHRFCSETCEDVLRESSPPAWHMEREKRLHAEGRSWAQRSAKSKAISEMDASSPKDKRGELALTSSVELPMHTNLAVVVAGRTKTFDVTVASPTPIWRTSDTGLSPDQESFYCNLPSVVTGRCTIVEEGCVDSVEHQCKRECLSGCMPWVGVPVGQRPKYIPDDGVRKDKDGRPCKKGTSGEKKGLWQCGFNADYTDSEPDPHVPAGAGVST